MSLITSVSFTEDAQVIAYGCKNGSVRLFYPESGCVKTLGSHTDQVCDLIVSKEVLRNMEAVVVASGSKNSDLKIWWDGGHEFSCKRIHKTAILEVKAATQGRFFARSRSEGPVLSVWRLGDGQFCDSYELDTKNSTTCLSTNKTTGMAALGSALGEVYVFYLDLDNKLNLVFTLQANAAFGPVRVVRFNDNGQILVTGHDVGALEIWDVTSLTSASGVAKNGGCRRLHAPLRLHQSWVTDIRFSRDSLHMVTVGDKIAWWSLGHMPRDTKASVTGSRGGQAVRKASTTTDPFRRRRRTESESNCGQSPGHSPIKREESLMSNSAFKVGQDQHQELLQVFDIRGASLSKIDASANFDKFVTVDDAGIAYVLEEIVNA